MSRSPEMTTAASPAPPTRISRSRITSPTWAAPLVSDSRPMLETLVNSVRNDCTPDCQAAGLTGIRAWGLVLSLIRSSIDLKLVYTFEANSPVYGLALPG